MCLGSPDMCVLLLENNAGGCLQSGGGCSAHLAGAGDPASPSLPMGCCMPTLFEALGHDGLVLWLTGFSCPRLKLTVTTQAGQLEQAHLGFACCMALALGTRSRNPGGRAQPALLP